MKEKLLKLLEEIQPYEEIDFETELFEEDILDSLEFAEFLTVIEDAFDICIPEDQINRANFATILEIEKLLSGLR